MGRIKRWMRTPVGHYLTGCAALALGALLFLLLDRFSLFDGILICPLHLLGIYCPTCGMTRAMHALLSLDFALMLRCHPLAPVLVAVVLYFAVAGFILALRGEQAPLSRVPRWPLYVLIALLFLFFVLRNVWLYAFSYDPLGDMLPT